MKQIWTILKTSDARTKIRSTQMVSFINTEQYIKAQEVQIAIEMGDFHVCKSPNQMATLP